MSETPADPPPPARVTLRCLAGGQPPLELGRDLNGIAALPLAAKQRFWEALGPSLSEPLSSSIEGQLDAFCRGLGAPKAELARALKACRFLVREASKVDLPRAALAEDLAALGANSEAQAILLGGYEKAKAFVRAEILRAALVSHGKLLVSADWRVDSVLGTAGGARLDAQVVLLTLSYQEGERRERITLQVAPEALRELKKMCEELLG
jgi:hypothetical protein